ncbi:MAG: ABC-2 transporter permease [Sarcina sp.]
MNTITNLIKKHITTNFLDMSTLVIFLGGLIYSIIFPHLSIYVTFFMVLYFCILSISSYENTKPNESNLYLPVTRNQIIKSLYLCNAIILVFIISLGIFFNFIEFGFDSSLGQALTMTTICLPPLLLSILIPIGFKFGMVWLQAISIGLCTYLGVFAQNSIVEIMKGYRVLDLDINLIPFILPATVTCIVIYILSMKLSIKLFKKVELP